MSSEKMGQLISELRKSKHLTQKDLADKLNITDKAVSKWERGLSCPDISLISPIADILGVTVSELLCGEQNSEAPAPIEKSIDDALQYAEKAVKSRTKSIQSICAVVFSMLLLISVVVCAICDLAISGRFTWSLFPISSIVFGWLTIFPVIKLGAKGVPGAFAALSLLIIPFLYVLDCLIGGNTLIMPIGVRVSLVSIAYIWANFGVFKIFKGRKLIASAVSLLLIIPLDLLVNYGVASIVSSAMIDIWDFLGFGIIIIASAILFVVDFIFSKKNT